MAVDSIMFLFFVVFLSLTSREGLCQVYDGMYVQISIGNEFGGPLNRKKGGTLCGLGIFHTQRNKSFASHMN